MGEALSRTDFLALSTKLCDDLRRWVSEAVHYHTLTADQLAMLHEATEVVTSKTVELTLVKTHEDRNDST
jgi:hypothetical protein